MVVVICVDITCKALTFFLVSKICKISDFIPEIHFLIDGA